LDGAVNPSRNFWNGRRVLVLGHTGFKGSWLCLWLHRLGADVAGLALPPPTEPSLFALAELQGIIATTFGDIRGLDVITGAMRAWQPEIVFHLAAQSLVRRSYRQPVETYATNVMGTVHVLEAIRSVPSVRSVVVVTSDKCYENREWPWPYRETDAMGGHDPYSSSKGCAELVTSAYRRSFFADPRGRTVGIATARAGNVIGGGDWSEDRLVSDLIRAAVANAPLRLRNPDAVRPWQHVLEPVSGYLRLGQGLLAGEPVEGPWNFGPTDDATVSVATLVARMQECWPSVLVETSPGPHPHEASILRLDCSKAAHELDWHPVWNAATTVVRTVGWYRAFHEHGELRSKDDLHDYITDARAAGIEWAG
jgi:CDP-glucose 4,6-dehydratase